jgi:RNA polymerase sigma factor (sigma-70 family)
MNDLKDLVIKARNGDLKAFSEIVRRFQDMTLGYAYSFLGDFYLAEDATQEAFIDLYRQIQNLRNPEAFSGWFRRIVFKHCDRITRKQRIPTIPVDEMTEVMTTADQDKKNEMQEIVSKEIMNLPEKERTVTTLFYINGYSQKEIGEFLEVPVTTIKKRLSNSRKILKGRMLEMVQNTLHENALPDDFGKQLLRFPFPKQEPTIEIIDCPGENLEIRCIDAQAYFVPLVEGGKCDWAFYDWPGGILTGVNEFHVISTVKWGQGSLFRVWRHETSTQNVEKQLWEERHLLVENDGYRWVKLDKDVRDEVRLSRYIWADGEISEPEPMKLKPGLKWANSKTEVTGVSIVTINERSWKCLKVVSVTQKPEVLAEWYVAENGRTVFFRRYNSPGWKSSAGEYNFESLAGNIEVEHNDITYRHWYDCIPDFTFESK